MSYRVLVLDELMDGADLGGSWAERLAVALNREEERGWVLLHIIPGRSSGTRTVQEAFVFRQEPHRAALAS